MHQEIYILPILPNLGMKLYIQYLKNKNQFFTDMIDSVNFEILALQTKFMPSRIQTRKNRLFLNEKKIISSKNSFQMFQNEEVTVGEKYFCTNSNQAVGLF